MKYTLLIPVKCWLLSCLITLVGCQSDISLPTPAGAITGTMQENHIEFLGIPYAQPPVGDRRWQPPVAMDIFSEAYTAQEFQSACMQFAQMNSIFESSEDCLYLNIWRPLTKQENLPVMVYIHGGGLATGAGSESRYNGQTLAIEQNVIVVTLNYRLGYLGFLSLPQLTQEQGHSGNYGFLDQQMALSWVNKNIESFGGNPNQVTLFGESAGANSTCLHLASPLSQDLFHNAILQSQGLYSSCANTLLTQQQGESLGETFSKIANCQEDTLACLRKKSIFNLNLSLLLKGFPMGPIHASDALPLRPVIDNYFITQQPMTSFEQGLASHKNILMGVNKNESTLFASFDDEIQTKDQYHTALNNRYPQLQSRLKELYPYEDYENGHEALADITGDETFVCRSIQLANQLSMAGSQVYFYHFTQTVDSYIDSILTLFGGNGMALGTFHASEIPYVFGIDSIFGSVNDDAQKTMNLIQDFWGNFSRTGQPSNSQTLIDWPPYNQNDKSILEISQQPLIREDLKPEKCLLWNNKPT